MSKQKSPEIQRLKQLLKTLDEPVSVVAEQTGISERTIKNTIWYNQPIGGQLLRQLRQCYSVSIDWLLSGEGEMFTDTPLDNHTPLMPIKKITDTRNCQDVLIVAAAAIEQAITQCGAVPGEDYTVLDLFNLAQPFAVEQFKKVDYDLKFFG